MHDSLWQSVLGEIEVSISHANFTTWFQHTKLLDCSEERVVIAVPNVFAIRQFEVKFNSQIKDVLARNGVTTKKISYIVKSTNSRKTVSREVDDAPLPPVDQLISQPTHPPSTPATTLNTKYTFKNFIVGSSN